MRTDQQQNKEAYDHWRQEVIGWTDEKLVKEKRKVYGELHYQRSDYGEFPATRAKLNAIKNEQRARGLIPARDDVGIYLRDDWRKSAAYRLFFAQELAYNGKYDEKEFSNMCFVYIAMFSALQSVFRTDRELKEVLIILEGLCKERNYPYWGPYANSERVPKTLAEHRERVVESK